jgi:hypothetical protein
VVLDFGSLVPVWMSVVMVFDLVGPMVVLVVPILFLMFPVYVLVLVPRSRYDAGGSGLGSLVQVLVLLVLVAR